MKASILLILATLLAFGGAATLQAQPMQRAALAEEGTGTWCQWCAYGAYTLDSMKRTMGDTLVVLSWHGPAGYPDPMWTSQGDSVEFEVHANAHPWLSAGRTWVNRNLTAPLGYPNAWDSSVRALARVKPAANVSVQNMRFDPSRKLFSFDVEIRTTSALPLASEDTCEYSVIAALTEDSIIASQEQAASPGFPRATIVDFRHDDVVRTALGSALGDPVTLASRTPSNPILKHYRIALDEEWNPAHCRIKVILLQRSRVTQWTEYLDASQTPYLTLATPPAGVITVLQPGEGDTLFIGRPTPVSFTVSSEVTANRSLQYSSNNGADWTVFGSVNGATTYQWTVPNSPSSEAIVRVVDDNGLTGKSGVFSIVPSGTVTAITVTGAPSVPANTLEQIQWTVQGLIGSSVDLDISYDGKRTWYPIVAGYHMEGTNLYSWVTPSFAAEGTIIRANFSSGASGFTAPFNIVLAGVEEDAGEVMDRLYPNPARDRVMIAEALLPHAEQLTREGVWVWDELGRALEVPIISRSDRTVELDTRALPAGIYRVIAKPTSSAIRFTIVR